MLQNYLKTMLRNMLRHKTNLTINLLGLTLAISCILLAAALILDERSFDNFHSKAEDIYRLNKRNINPTTGEERYTIETSGLMGPTMAKEYPEVKEFVRVQPWFDEVIVSYQEKNFKVKDFVFVDSSFFDVFDFKLLRGDPNTILTNPASIVLTQSLANKLFNEADPIGQTLIGLNDVEFTVTGLAADPPRNSSIQFDALVSWTTTVPDLGPLNYSFMNNWLGQTHYTYLLLEDKALSNQLESKFEDFMERNFPERADQYFLYLQPFTEVYLHSADLYGHRNFPRGSNQFIQVFIIIASFILLIACVNYININTAKATKRSMEVGLRKAMGANGKQLVSQFLGESFIMVFLSTALALLLADFLLSQFNTLAGKSIELDILLTIPILLIILGIMLVVSFIAGLYPAVILSSFQPSSVLKSGASNSSSGSKPRQLLTWFQFFISITLIAVTILVYQQNQFMQNKELGFDKEQVAIISTDNPDYVDYYQEFKNRLTDHPDIESVSVCQAGIGTGTFGTTVIPEGMNEEMTTQVFRVDLNFLETYGMTMKEGRWFDASDDPSLIKLVVNERFVELAGWDDPLHNKVRFSPDSPERDVIGVVKNFNYLPLNEYRLDPVLMAVVPNRITNTSVRLTGENIQETLTFIEDLWNSYGSRYPFDYYFVDQWFAEQYESQSKLLKTISIFSVISILLACLGLYGLTSFTIEQKTKEIGIRKVFGASLSDIAFLINKKFVYLVALAFVLSSPMAYYFVQKWLQNFAYRIEIAWWVFPLAGAAALFIAITAVSVQTIKGALTDPAKSLKYE